MGIRRGIVLLLNCIFFFFLFFFSFFLFSFFEVSSVLFVASPLQLQAISRILMAASAVWPSPVGGSTRVFTVYILLLLLAEGFRYSVFRTGGATLQDC